MKKIICIPIVAVLLCACILCGCTVSPKYVKITFVQDGCPSVVRNIPYGQAATGVPTPQSVKGHTVVWENADLSCMTTDTVIHAIVTPNNYTVTFDANGGICDEMSSTFTYGCEFSLPKATKNGYVFVGWFDGETQVSGGVWSTDYDLTLVAKWTKEDEYLTVTFVQDGCDNIVRTVKAGDALTDIPEPQPARGHTVKWEDVDLSCVTSNITVYAVATPNTYTITYNLQNKQGATISSVTQQVVFGQSFVLLTPYCPTSKFVKWLDETTQQAVENGVWSIDGNVTLIAVWTDEGWSDFH